MAASIDRRRNNGPQDSYLPQFDAPDVAVAVDGAKSDADGTEDLPSVFLRTAIVASSNGSCFYERGETKILSTVHGPRPATTTTTVTTTGRGGGGPGTARLSVSVTRQDGSSDRGLADCVSTAIEAGLVGTRYPKSEIAIVVRVVQEQEQGVGKGVGEVVVGCIVAASLALADAGIQLFDLVSAATVARSLDGVDVGLVIGYLPNRQEVTLMHLVGGTQHGHVEALMKAAIKRAEAMHLAMTKVLMDA
ncbi:protein of unknown function [Taphrina deformans PYCC 5710]|uniref:Exoribonuclease phosphorolytic domain-containing protein n=1 Tax=Taphrina deformans (strain PYCC 5710 / ATCC 11124 / CBS 356.35 / IMI 108563 / JCM 9778 / NBRC 8474) TaxID=1097556 RepID=R4XH20_TAPDE|nr:protein of unknown function [Taphrina deformans PYCC 5710]|eukprot:CCG82671.1 protein of unknown function [Taphrina deformans PYCC 5710]